jgi:hypothetical protein
MSTFEQILDMDDDEDDKEFSKGIVFGFLEQAVQTFQKMSDSLYNRPLAHLFEVLLIRHLVHQETFPNCHHWDTFSKDPRRRLALSRSRTNVKEYSTLVQRKMRQAPLISKMRSTAYA